MSPEYCVSAVSISNNTNDVGGGSFLMAVNYFQGPFRVRSLQVLPRLCWLLLCAAEGLDCRWLHIPRLWEEMV